MFEKQKNILKDAFSSMIKHQVDSKWINELANYIKWNDNKMKW